MKGVVLVLFFLLMGAFFIVSEHNLGLAQEGNFSKFLGYYAAWVYQVFDNGTGVAGYVVKMDWLPDSNVKELDENHTIYGVVVP